MNLLLRLLFIHAVFCIFTFQNASAQAGTEEIKMQTVKGEKKIIITADDKAFASFLFPDTLEKPVLFPIYAADGNLITRGFPLLPRANDPTDHPHHVGLWMNYENVNGLDFWNNSYAIAADKKHLYGWIVTDSILQIRNGEQGILKYHAKWEGQQKNILLNEETKFIFSAQKNIRFIDRITTLTAQQDISFPDAKDGMLGLRVAHELELPSNETKKFTDNNGNVTIVNADSAATGNYLTSEGFQGDSAWSTRGRWCMLYGKMNEDSISIVIIDHPQNIGYPTYWHARGYGLFAANPLGQKIFSNEKQSLNFSLPKGVSVTFRYRIIIASGKERLTALQINHMADAFAETK